MNINHARKAGVVVHEYCPLKQRDAQIEADLNRITNEWLQQKKSSMLTFVMGTVGLENPMDKRYFYATDADGKIVAFIVFVPFLGKRGYMADVTRHGTGAPSGVMETILYDAFQVFKDEGIEYGSLGVAPLAGLENDSPNPVEKLLCFAYDHLNDCYGFRDLYRAKEKYSPTEWVLLLYLPAEDSNTRHVLCPCDDSESASDPRGSGGSGKRMGAATEKQEDFPDTSE